MPEKRRGEELNSVPSPQVRVEGPEGAPAAHGARDEWQPAGGGAVEWRPAQAVPLEGDLRLCFLPGPVGRDFFLWLHTGWREDKPQTLSPKP